MSCQTLSSPVVVVGGRRFSNRTTVAVFGMVVVESGQQHFPFLFSRDFLIFPPYDFLITFFSFSL